MSALYTNHGLRGDQFYAQGMECRDKAVISYYSKKYKPVPLPEKSNYSQQDMSIIVPTIDTESTFTECIRL